MTPDSEFPSLSGAPQTQQNPGQAIWGQRPNQASQLNPSSRNQQAQQSRQSQANPLPSHQSLQPGTDEFFSTASLSAALGDYSLGSHFPESNQPQTGNVDDFPPLGRESSLGLGQERRESAQNNAFSTGYGASLGFAGMMQQSRDPLSNALDRDKMVSSAGLGMGRELLGRVL